MIDLAVFRVIRKHEAHSVASHGYSSILKHPYIHKDFHAGDARGTVTSCPKHYACQTGCRTHLKSSLYYDMVCRGCILEIGKTIVSFHDDNLSLLTPVRSSEARGGMVLAHVGHFPLVAKALDVVGKAYSVEKAVYTTGRGTSRADDTASKQLCRYIRSPAV